jgi:hypothetical protein
LDFLDVPDDSHVVCLSIHPSIHPSVHPSICLFAIPPACLPMALQSFCWTLASFHILNIYTVGRTPWTGGGSDRRKASTYTQNNTNTE